MLNNVPVPGQSLGSSRDLINANFVTINTAFSVNHVQYNDGSGNQGFHQFVQFPTGMPSGTTLVTPQVALYSNLGAISGIPELFFQRSGLAANLGYSITESTANTPGWTRLPSGILLKWQTNVSFGGASSKSINLNTIGVGPNFATLFTILITPISTVNFDHVLAISSQVFPSFTVSTMNGSAAPATTFFAYLAIGN